MALAVGKIRHEAPKRVTIKGREVLNLLVSVLSIIKPILRITRREIYFDLGLIKVAFIAGEKAGMGEIENEGHLAFSNGVRQITGAIKGLSKEIVPIAEHFAAALFNLKLFLALPRIAVFDGFIV